MANSGHEKTLLVLSYTSEIPGLARARCRIGIAVLVVPEGF
jgi:hypothetical protein